MMAGFLLIDKPKGITSHDVVYSVRRISGEKKVGHAGTLDPNATGLLIVGVGKAATKKMGEITKNTTKEYEASIILGETRDSDDTEGAVLKKTIIDNPPETNKLKEVLLSFEGEGEQIPPIFSAIKIKGKKAYELARKGKRVELKPRKITVYSIKLTEYDYPALKFVSQVSSGTYIRSIARDIGEKLKTGAYLADLRRTKIGEYNVKDAIPLNKLNKINFNKHLFQIT